jgi:ubiquinone/menaquinone biosynthesis C-methylase UbiE
MPDRFADPRKDIQTSDMPTGDTQRVQNFWNVAACGTQFVADPKNEREFFEEYCKFRYATEWHIPALVASTDPRGKSVLEIGTGNGADGVLFAQSGARYTGVDLTETAIDATRRHFDLLGLPGTFQVENAERLSFPDNSFDIVYSYGVLHHSPHPARAIEEVHRVLRLGGQAVVMLYHKNSFNYYVRITSYMRLRVLAKILSRAGRWRRDRETLLTGEEVRGNQDARIWDVHYWNFLREGWSYLRADDFVAHCTDGPACPFAYVYTRRDARKLFSKFREVETRAVHFPIRKYPLGRMFPVSIEKMLAGAMGWYLLIRAVK